MAAKVVLVAVPTVLGIASIRVYTVREAPADGVKREKLNIYTPLPPSAQVKFVPASPGLIENGLATVREGVLPVYTAVKGAGVSVKTGTINLYHTGQDVFFYLKDPPPDFLPRFGTITMAGLLGMFLTRKGSHLKKLAVPLGLMSAAASVCYPAQAVAVCKVSGKKLYAAGQWSGAAVSSLFTVKKPVAKASVTAQPQSATVPNSTPDLSSLTDAKAQSSTIPETEVESAESAPVSDEPVSAVITEEESSVTLPEISPDPVPTETGSVPSESPTPSEAETSPASAEAPKQAAEEVSAAVSSAESASSPGAAEATSAESAPAESAAVEAAPVEIAPIESAPVEVAPVKLPQSKLHPSSLPQLKLPLSKLHPSSLPQLKLPQSTLHPSSLPQSKLPQSKLHPSSLPQSKLPQ
ncbi:unnamed protein product [Ophioblennius macclurei]